MQSAKTLASFDTQKRKFYDEDLTAGGRLGIFLDSAKKIRSFLLFQCNLTFTTESKTTASKLRLFI